MNGLTGDMKGKGGGMVVSKLASVIKRLYFAYNTAGYTWERLQASDALYEGCRYMR